jgi:hypothetical protein
LRFSSNSAVDSGRQLNLGTGNSDRTSHHRHSLQHCFPILFPHVNLVIHRFDFFKCPSETCRFGIVFQIDLFDDLELFFELLRLGIFGILIFFRFRQVFPQLLVSILPG